MHHPLEALPQFHQQPRQQQPVPTPAHAKVIVLGSSSAAAAPSSLRHLIVVRTMPAAAAPSTPPWHGPQTVRTVAVDGSLVFVLLGWTERLALRGEAYVSTRDWPAVSPRPWWPEADEYVIGASNEDPPYDVRGFVEATFHSPQGQRHDRGKAQP